MAQESAINVMNLEETLAMLRHQNANVHGYALALAQQANLTPEEAVQVFMAPYSAYFASLSYEPGLSLLEQQAQQNAAMLALSNGEQNVRLERDGETWLITTKLPDIEGLERWGQTWIITHAGLKNSFASLAIPKASIIKCGWMTTFSIFSCP